MTCFDRVDETAEIWRQIKDHKNLLMLAPRRIGKTVLLNHLRDTAADKGYRAVLLDVEGFREEKDFFRQCCAAIQEELSTGVRVMTAFGERLSRIWRGGGDQDDWRHWLLRTDWKDFADHLLAHLDEHGDDPPWLILVDELPVFVQALRGRDGDQGIGDFLYWLRNMRQKYTRVRWFYTGSIGLDGIARRYRVEGALNDLDPFPLSPFSPETARDFLASIAAKRTCTLDPGVPDVILQRLGWLSPYYLDKIAEDACQIARGAGASMDANAANAAMDRMLDLSKRLDWSTWREHLDRNLPEPERSRLYALLQTVAKSDAAQGASHDTLLHSLNRVGEPVGPGELRDLLDTLISDGYLDVTEVDGQNRYRFRMNLLREWWLRYVVL